MIDKFLDKQYTDEEKKRYPYTTLLFDYINTLRSEFTGNDFVCDEDTTLEMIENYLSYCNDFHILNYIKQLHLGKSQIPLPCEVNYPRSDSEKEILKERANINRQLRELTSSCFTWPDCTTCDKHDECYENADEYRILSVDLPNNIDLGKTH
ncbi:MAG: hypothetical protein ACI3T9_05005 [Romboutsia timonensis]